MSCHLFAFLKKEFRLYRRYRFALLLNLFSLSFGVITFLFLGRLYDSSGQLTGQFKSGYFPYLAIGIAASSFLASALNGLSSSLQQEQASGTLESILLAPISEKTVILGLVTWNMLLSLMTAFAYLMGAVLLSSVEISISSLCKAGIICTLSLGTFLGLGILAGSFILYFKRGNPIAWILTSLSILISGVYFPVELLPKSVQLLSHIHPLTYSIAALRMALLEEASWSVLSPYLTVLGGFSIILSLTAFQVFAFSLRKTKMKAAISHI